MKKFIIIVILIITYIIFGVLSERHSLIQAPAWWALYGAVYGAIITTILNHQP